MRKNRLSILLMLFISVSLMLAACGGGGGGTKEPSPDATLDSIEVTPANPSIEPDAIRQFTATGTYSDGGTKDLTASVTWSSSVETCATIDASGLATAVASGATTITATSGGITGTTDLTVTATAPAIAGFDFVISEGDYWEYGWDYYRNYWDSFGGGSTTNRKGVFRVTLGSPVVINGVSAHEVLISGSTKPSDSNDLKPRWKYLAVSGNQILASTDTTSMVAVFNAQTGIWPGSGFLASFPSSTLFEATLSTISNDYINETAYKVSESASESQCKYFPGYGTICGGDYNENLQEEEYYIAGVGAVGMYSYSSISDMTGPYPWGSSKKINVGLVNSSLRGDIVDYELEVEPNNQIINATAMTLPARIKGDSIGETFFGGSTPVFPGVASVAEAEPNDSPFAPQAVSMPSTITGDVLNGDTATNVEVEAYPGAGLYTTSFEDWYEFTLGAGATVGVDLDFSTGPAADLDMYIFTLEPGPSVVIHASSVDDNINVTGTYTETMSQYLSADTYYVGVDAYDTTGGRVNYTLSITTGSSSVNIVDWYSLTLDAQKQVSITVTGTPTFVLMDATATSTLASGASASALLNAGDYLIGVTAGGPYTLEATSP